MAFRPDRLRSRTMDNRTKRNLAYSSPAAAAAVIGGLSFFGAHENRAAPQAEHTTEQASSQFEQTQFEKTLADTEKLRHLSGVVSTENQFLTLAPRETQALLDHGFITPEKIQEYTPFTSLEELHFAQNVLYSPVDDKYVASRPQGASFGVQSAPLVDSIPYSLTDLDPKAMHKQVLTPFINETLPELHDLYATGAQALANELGLMYGAELKLDALSAVLVELMRPAKQKNAYAIDHVLFNMDPGSKSQFAKFLEAITVFDQRANSVAGKNPDGLDMQAKIDDAVTPLLEAVAAYPHFDDQRKTEIRQKIIQVVEAAGYSITPKTVARR